MFFKRSLKLIPEIYFLLFCTWWVAGTWTDFFNFPGIVLGTLLLFQVFSGNKPIGLALSLLFLLGSLYLILALWSDVVRLSAIDSSAVAYISKAGALIAVNITMAILMFRNYTSARHLAVNSQ